MNAFRVVIAQTCLEIRYLLKSNPLPSNAGLWGRKNHELVSFICWLGIGFGKSENWIQTGSCWKLERLTQLDVDLAKEFSSREVIF